MQTYGYVPDLVKVRLNECPGAIGPEFASADPSYVGPPVGGVKGFPGGAWPSAGNVTVCNALFDWFTHVRVVPAVTVTVLPPS
jgi:hypothetical protein